MSDFTAVSQTRESVCMNLKANNDNFVEMYKIISITQKLTCHLLRKVRYLNKFPLLHTCLPLSA